MDIALPLDQMTAAEKLPAMELLWDDLCSYPEDIPSPAWHAEVLRPREKLNSRRARRISPVGGSARATAESRMKIEILAEAEQDLLDGIRFYERQC